MERKIKSKIFGRQAWSRLAWATILMVIIVGGFEGGDTLKSLFERFGTDRVTRRLQGEIFGAMPKPTQPALTDPVKEVLQPQQKTRRVVVRRIPQIKPGQKMPHHYWGPCLKCHLFEGGPPPGSQPITPVGKVWEKVSSITKVGPPILPNSRIPHPPSGRCIKCHDIVIQVPVF
ncbi:MAG: magnetochrome domain-containing protein [Magnetococcales bacterium]|nr:magnetochrome domain-containing protein [Magnetococcales bacterium]